MKISILTPSYNQGSFVEKTIQSVMSQNYPDFEHIIIDGGSTDNTVEILKKYPHLKWVSESDEGQADALNKGLAIATGDIVGWINSDDYYEDDIFRDVVSHFEESNINWIIGNITFVYPGLGIERPDKSPVITYGNLLRNPDILRQQGVFFRKALLDEIGGLNKDFYMVMDYDLWIRIAQKHPPMMINKNYAYFLWHEDQKSTPRNTLTQAKEINLILKENNLTLVQRLLVLRTKYIYLFKSTIKNILITIGLIDKKYSAIPISASRVRK